MIQTFDGQRHAVLVDPGEIRTGDWMRDLGRLRQVEAVEASDAPPAPSVVVRFADDEDGQFATLSVPDGVIVAVWRALAEAAGVSPCTT